MKMRLALAQIQILPGNLSGNSQKAGELIVAAEAQNADLVLLPELWSSGYDLSRSAEHATANQHINHSVVALASQHHNWIGGSLLKIHNKKIFKPLHSLTRKAIATLTTKKFTFSNS